MTIFFCLGGVSIGLVLIAMWMLRYMVSTKNSNGSIESFVLLFGQSLQAFNKRIFWIFISNLFMCGPAWPQTQCLSRVRGGCSPAWPQTQCLSWAPFLFFWEAKTSASTISALKTKLSLRLFGAQGRPCLCPCLCPAFAFAFAFAFTWRNENEKMGKSFPSIHRPRAGEGGRPPPRNSLLL